MLGSLLELSTMSTLLLELNSSVGECSEDAGIINSMNLTIVTCTLIAFAIAPIAMTVGTMSEPITWAIALPIQVQQLTLHLISSTL